MLDVVSRLLSVEAELVATVTCPLDRRRPGNDEDRIKLRNLHAQAREQLMKVPGSVGRRVAEHLDNAFASIDPRGADGVFVVATPDGSEAHLVPFPVRASVELGTTPATRFLVQGLRRSPRYRVLVLSERATRLFEMVRDDAVEITSGGFPMSADITTPDHRAVAGRFARGEGDETEQVRAFYRDVDRALTEVCRDDPLPLVLIGVERSLVTFEEVSENKHRITARITGAHDRTSPHELGALTWEIMRERLRQRRQEVVQQLSDAVGTRRAVTGIDEVWQLGRDGRGRLLVVEEDYRAQPAREVDGRLVFDVDGDDVMDDPVDELIEHVVRAGGSVEFVASGALHDRGRIGLILR